jgi:hypothetical protein
MGDGKKVSPIIGETMRRSGDVSCGARALRYNIGIQSVSKKEYHDAIV